jgi:hypothetical protein
MEEPAASEELAPIGEAIRADLAGSIDAGLIASQQAALGATASELSVALERGLPSEAPRSEFASVAAAGWPVYEHLGEVGFWESTTSHLPEFSPEYLNTAVNAFVASEGLTGVLESFEFVGGQPVDVIASVIGSAQELSEFHWAATDEIPREELEFGDFVPPMTQGAAGGALLWLDDIDQHLWTHEVLLTEDILADAVWHGQAMAAGFQLMAEGAKVIGNEEGSLSDAELGGLLSTGFAVQALSQGTLPADVYWVTEGMRDNRRTDLGRAVQ